ncbi:uncharacterized protein LOC127611634 [Hippocampus zosterae]|uniref:uncharacterized protein LOC127611634 n=1 Tax=Hippocampus zosterae TaxID=109293 RepID=UPI00223D7DF7|nr:uncharacterized protein LOC127611634 [Hippocampus zosterae]
MPNMRFVLVLMAAISLLPGATSQVTGIPGTSIPECPINYYGETYFSPSGIAVENVFELNFGNSDFMTFTFEVPVQPFSFDSIFDVANETSEFALNLPDLVGTSDCFYGIILFSGPNAIQILFRTFGNQGAYLVDSPVPLNVTTTVGGQLVSTTELSAGKTYAYLRGCRHEGQFYPVGTKTLVSATVFVTCNSTAFLTVSNYDPRCSTKSGCTMTVIWSPIDQPTPTEIPLTMTPETISTT